MATLIITILVGLIIAYFATQNTGGTSLHFLNYTLSDIPTYVVVIGALLIGLLLSWLVSLVNDIATGFTIRNKENKIKDYKKENAELTKRIHQLELENTRLKERHPEPIDEKTF